MEELAAPDNELTIGAPKHCRAGSGGTWIAEAWRLFKSSWLEFLVALVVMDGIGLAFYWLPYVGGLLAIFLMPFLTAGYLQMAHKAQQDEDPGIGDLFAAFRSDAKRRVDQLLLLGLASLIGMNVIMALVAITSLPMLLKGVGGMDGVLHLFQAITQHESPQQIAQMLRSELQAGPLFLGSMLALSVFLLLYVFYSCAMWFAVPLVWFSDTRVLAALRLSLLACGRNAGAVIVYSLLAFLLGVLGTIPLLLGLLVVLPVLAISTYTGFRQIFVD